MKGLPTAIGITFSLVIGLIIVVPFIIKGFGLYITWLAKVLPI